MPESLGQRIIAAHQAGVAEKRQEEERIQRQEERKLQQQQLKLQMEHLKHQQAIEDFKLQYGALQGAPAQRKPVESLPGIGAPPSIIGQTATGPAGLQQQMPHPALTVPGSTIQAQPQTLEELFRQRDAAARQASMLKLQEAAQEPFTLAGEAVRVIPSMTGEPPQVYTNPKPVETPKAPPLQSKEGTIGGLRTFANYDSSTGKYFIGGVDVSKDFKPISPEPNLAGSQARQDRSFNSRSSELEKVAQPVADSLQRFGRLKDTIDTGSPIADSLTAPELMVVMAGGAGSGVRITQAEINTIMGGQSKWERARAALAQWSTDPAKANRILEPMRNQIKTLLDTVNKKLVAKEAVIEGARQQLIDTEDPKAHKQILADAKKALTGVDMGKTADGWKIIGVK